MAEEYGSSDNSSNNGVPTEGDWDAECDAKVLHQAEQIKSNSVRHQGALQHLAEYAQSAKSAHKAARKKLELNVKGKLAKTFGKALDADTAPQVNQETFGTENG